MTSNECMTQWGNDWALVDGSVQCVRCSQKQTLEASGDELVHSSECGAEKGLSHRPWVALLEAIEREHG